MLQEVCGRVKREKKMRVSCIRCESCEHLVAAVIFCLLWQWWRLLPPPKPPLFPPHLQHCCCYWRWTLETRCC